MDQTNNNQYMFRAYEVLSKAKELFLSEDWKSVLCKNDVHLFNLNLDVCPFPAYRVRASYSKSKEEMVNKIWGVMSEDMAKHNDPKLTSWTLVDHGPNWKVMTQTNSVVWPIWPRQVLFSQVRIDEGNHTYLVSESIDRTYVHNVDGHVMAHLHMSVYDYCDNNDGTTTVDRITLLDPKGGMPVSLVTMYSGNLVNLFASWKNE
jgi:hypothetical protein